MNAPTAIELLASPTVLDALERAWADSLAGEPDLRHEEGGWIYVHLTQGTLHVRRAAPGMQAALDLNSPPPMPECIIVATFHTHPNPSVEGWYPGPSVEDMRSAWWLGVPCIIRADDGVYTAGPDARRGGLVGSAGFPDCEE